MFNRLRRCKILLHFSFLIFASGVSFADASTLASPSQLKNYSGRKIQSVHVEGYKRIEKEAVLAKILSQSGGRLSLDRVSRDIKEIYEMGFFNDVEVRAVSVPGNQVELVYEVRERPVISEIEFDGNEKIGTGDLQEVIKVKQWSILDIDKINEDVDRIQKHYEEKGFYLAKVRHDIQSIKDDEVKLVFKINDYDKVRIKKVTFLNNKHFSDAQLKQVLMDTQEGGFFSFMSGAGSFKEAAFRQDLLKLTFWYLDHGFVKFRYENPQVTISEDKQWLYISIYVEEGQKYNMGKIDFEGDLLYSKEELRESITLNEGDVFRISKRNQDIQNLTEKYQDLGYAFVNVIPQMQIHDDTKTVDITYKFEKGELTYFGEINITGNTKTHDKVIRRELKIAEGELYHGTRLRISRERVERLGYFKPGEVLFNTITRKDKDNVLDVEIQVKERSTGTITLGAGYGSVQKFFLQTQVSEINLFGKGQTLSFQAQYSADRKNRSFNLGFTDPYAFDTRWSMGFDLFYTTFRIPDRYTTRKLGFDIRLGHPIGEDIFGFITYKHENLKVQDKEDPEDDTSLEEGLLSSIVLSAVRDKRNNRFETTSGSYQKVSLEYAGIGGDKFFAKWILNARYYKPVLGDLVFRTSWQYGQIAQTTRKGIPASEKFYLGGANNMRGFKFAELGPSELNSSGLRRASGGRVELFALFELEYPLIKEAGLKWVTFFDVGNAFQKFPGSGSENFTLRRDIGFGFRWFSPIGPLRFEWGFPFARREGEDESTFHFFIGPPF